MEKYKRTGYSSSTAQSHSFSAYHRHDNTLCNNKTTNTINTSLAMISIKTLIPAAAILFASSTNALGCYGGWGFDEMHGRDSVNTIEEVKADIATTCGIVDGATFKRGDPPYTRCSTWDAYVGEKSFYHINWAIQLADTNDYESLVMTKEKCIGALEREVGGCNEGSEQNNGGFWYKIDPNFGECGTPQDSWKRSVEFKA